ncbi:MAG: STAS domain-containing protein [Planctomycetes bacterium]|nr:STAS domain-containing protein [Planctomycetota bacterium]
MDTPDILRAYDVQIDGQRLVITIRKEFDFGNLHQDWAHAITVQHPGPFTEVVVDLSRCGIVSSTFFAGLMQLHNFYKKADGKPLVLAKPDNRVLRTLTMMRLDQLFTILPR